MFSVTTALQMAPLTRLLAGGALGAACDAAVDAWAEHIAAAARQNAHVITGAMKESTGVVSPLRDDYTPRQSRAAARNPRGQFATVPERPAGHSAVVQVGVHYGVFEEYGTSRRGPHPFFTPAVELGRAQATQVTAPPLTRALERP